MRKFNLAIQDREQTRAVVQRRSNSWIPPAPFALAALDPARWSQRKQQANLWRLLDQMLEHRALH